MAYFIVGATVGGGGGGGGGGTTPVVGNDVLLASSAPGKYQTNIGGLDVMVYDNADGTPAASTFTLKNGSYAGGTSPLLRFGTAATGAALMSVSQDLLSVRTGEGGNNGALVARDMATVGVDPVSNDSMRCAGNFSFFSTASRIKFATFGTLMATSDGVLQMTDTATTGFNGLTFGPSLVTMPAIFRNGTQLRLRNGINTADIGMSGAGFVTNVTPALTAPQFSHSNTASAGLHINGSTGVPSLCFSGTQNIQISGTSIQVNHGGPLQGQRDAVFLLTSTSNPSATGSGGVFSNHTATAAATTTVGLTTASTGLFYYVVMIQTGQINITSAGTIRIGAVITAAGGTMKTTTVGSTVCLLCYDNTNWIAIDYTGTWLLGP